MERAITCLQYRTSIKPEVGVALRETTDLGVGGQWRAQSQIGHASTGYLTSVTRPTSLGARSLPAIRRRRTRSSPPADTPQLTDGAQPTIAVCEQEHALI